MSELCPDVWNAIAEMSPTPRLYNVSRELRTIEQRVNRMRYMRLLTKYPGLFRGDTQALTDLGREEPESFDFLEYNCPQPFHNLEAVARGAANGGHRDLVYRLLRRGVSPGPVAISAAEGGHWDLAMELIDSPNPPLGSLARIAAKRGERDRIYLLVEKAGGEKIITVGVVAAAASGGHLDLMKELMAEVEIDSRDASILAFEISGHGTVEMLESILPYQPRLDDCLNNAARYGNLEVVRYLSTRPWDQRELDEAASSAGEGGYTEIINILLNLGASPTAVGVGAATRGRTTLVLDMLAKGADGEEILPYAAENGHISLVRTLLNRHIVPQDEAIEKAARAGYLEIVQLLTPLTQGSLTEAANEATVGNRLEIVKYLLDTGRVDDISVVAITAAEFERPNILLELLRRGADIDSIFEYSQTIEEIDGIEFLSEEIENLLLEYRDSQRM
jgi:hypothetical protein